MERNHAIVVAVVVAALSLFGLKFWSDRTAASTLEAESRGASERLARASGLHGAPDSWSPAGSGSDRDYSRPGGPLRAGNGGAGAAGHAVGPDGRVGGSAGSLRAGGSTVGGPLGVSAGGRLPGGWGGAPGDGTNVVGGEGGHAAPKAAQKQNLVDFLSSQPPTQANLGTVKASDGDVALKLDKTEDITSQGGRDNQNVEQSANGDGITVGATGDMTFPNTVSPDAATIAFQFTPNWAGSDQTDNALLELRGENDWSNRLELVKNGDFLRFILTPSDGKESDISYNISGWQPGEQHQIQAVYGNGQMSLSDGSQVLGTNTYTAPLQISENTPLHVGGAPQGSTYGGANGTFTGLTIMNNTPAK